MQQQQQLPAHSRQTSHQYSSSHTTVVYQQNSSSQRSSSQYQSTKNTTTAAGSGSRSEQSTPYMPLPRAELKPYIESYFADEKSTVATSKVHSSDDQRQQRINGSAPPLEGKRSFFFAIKINLNNEIFLYKIILKKN